MSSPRNARSAARRASSNGRPKSVRVNRTFIHITSGLDCRRSASTPPIAAGSSADAMTRDTSPIASISAAVYVRPVHVISSARPSPTRVGNTVTPTGAKKPSRISGWPNVARSLARSTSAIIANSNPAPSAAPSTAITRGSSLAPSTRNSRLNAAIISGACSGRCSPMSAPAENARPFAPITTPQRDRCRLEMEIARRLDHPGIQHSLDPGGDRTRPYLVMQYVEGETLREYLGRRGNMPIAEAVALVDGLADAMGYAHSQGITHRDLKPENVLVTPDGRPIVTDFGIALISGAM